MSSDTLSFFATWALAHELADQEYRAAVARAGSGSAGEGRPESLSDRLVLLIDEEKERLKSRLAEVPAPEGRGEPPDETMVEIRFELAELRARLETIESSLDAVLRKLE